MCMDTSTSSFLSRFLSREFVRPDFCTTNILEERGTVELFKGSAPNKHPCQSGDAQATRYSPCAPIPQQVSICAQPNVRKKPFIAAWKLLHSLKPRRGSRITRRMTKTSSPPPPPQAAVAAGIQAPVALTLCNTPDQIIRGGKRHSAPAELRRGPVLTHRPRRAAGEGRCPYLI